MSKKTWIIIGASAGAVIAAVLILWLSLAGMIDRSDKSSPYRYTVRRQGENFILTVKGNRDAELGFDASMEDLQSIAVKERASSNKKVSYRVKAGEEAGSDRLTVTLSKKDGIVPDIRYTLVCDFLTSKSGELSYLGSSYSVPGKSAEIYEEVEAFSYGFSYNGYGDMIAALGHKEGESWVKVTEEGSPIHVEKSALDDRDLFIIYGMASNTEEEVSFLSRSAGLIVNCLVRSDGVGQPEVVSHEVKAAVQEEVFDAELRNLYHIEGLIPTGEAVRNRLMVIYSLHGEEGLLEALGISEFPGEEDEDEDAEAYDNQVYLDSEGHVYRIVSESVRDHMKESGEDSFILYITDVSELPKGAYRPGEEPETSSEESVQSESETNGETEESTE